MAVEADDDIDAEAKAAADVNAADMGVQPKVATAAAADDDRAAEIANLKAQMERHKQEAAAARAESAQFAQRSQQSETQAVDNQLMAFKNLQSAKIAEIANTKAALKIAREQADFDKESELIELLGTLAAQKVRIGEAIDYESAQQQQRQQQRQQPQRQQTQDEVFLASLAPRARSWMQANPGALPSGPQHKLAMSAHWAALNEGLQEGSDQYYDYLSGALGGQRQERQAAPTQQRQQAYVAPVTSRQPSNGGQRLNNGRTLQLGPNTRQTAADLDMTDKEYAMYAQEEIDAGRASPNDYLN